MPKFAANLSMLFNELATNATKYGAWSNRKGSVFLDWKLVRSEDGGETLHLVWKERGGPLVTPPGRAGFGSSVIKFSVERSLRGKADVDYASEGITYRISIPWQSEA